MPTQCYISDQAAVNEIADATAQLAKEAYSFAYYKLGLAADDWECFEKMDIAKRSVFSYWGQSESMLEELIVWVSSLAPGNSAVAPKAASIVAQITEHIIDASSFNTALVVIKAEPARKEPPLPGWHIDKTFQEYIDANTLYDKHPIYLATLKGMPTLYYQANSSTYSAFIEGSTSPYLSYGCDENPQCSIAQLIDWKAVSLPPVGYGSAHLRGKQHGTIHANFPAFNERLVVMVTPYSQDAIAHYQQVLAVRLAF